ncbi:hypothetical protein [Kribbella catacumbae]|uniref:hypothetical protein n=1 Tax=Kribbella catacumbae TaxID=460086 RepID=UPI00146A669B|nr:hypothetical protein [Kribbella catacumbae]
MSLSGDEHAVRRDALDGSQQAAESETVVAWVIDVGGGERELVPLGVGPDADSFFAEVCVAL